MSVPVTHRPAKVLVKEAGRLRPILIAGPWSFGVHTAGPKCNKKYPSLLFLLPSSLVIFALQATCFDGSLWSRPHVLAQPMTAPPFLHGLTFRKIKLVRMKFGTSGMIRTITIKFQTEWENRSYEGVPTCLHPRPLDGPCPSQRP